MTTDPPQFLKPAEAAAICRVSARTLANWRTQGKGPKFTKLGGKVLYHIDQLQHWMKRNTVQSTGEYTRD